MGNFGSISAQTANASLVVPQNLARKGLLLKAPKSNTSRVWLQMTTAATPTSANALLPLEAGESLFLATDFPQISGAEWNDSVFVIADPAATAAQDLRFIEF